MANAFIPNSLTKKRIAKMPNSSEKNEAYRYDLYFSLAYNRCLKQETYAAGILLRIT